MGLGLGVCVAVRTPYHRHGMWPDSTQPNADPYVVPSGARNRQGPCLVMGAMTLS